MGDIYSFVVKHGGHRKKRTTENQIWPQDCIAVILHCIDCNEKIVVDTVIRRKETQIRDI